MTTGTATVIRANALHLPLADNSVDLVVTSPPARSSGGIGRGRRRPDER